MTDSPVASSSSDNFPRRQFLAWLWQGAYTLGLGFSFLSLWRFWQAPRLALPNPTWVVGEPAQFKLGSVTLLAAQQAWLIRERKGFYALRAVCTHLGCPPTWQETQQQFHCLCHGSRFGKTGMLKQGPALRPLERYKIFLNAQGQICLDLSQSYHYERGEWEDPAAYLAWQA